MLNKCLLLLTGLFVFCTARAQRELRPINIDDHAAPIDISLGTIFGAGRGFSSVYSGFDVDDGTMATFYPGGGLFAGFDSYFTYANYISFGLAYKYQVSGLDMSYENAESTIKKNVLTPALKINPFPVKKGRIFFGIGLEILLSNTFEISAEQESYKEIARYEFNQSAGPIFFVEYQEDINSWLGAKAGLKSGFIKYKLNEYSYSHKPLSLKSGELPQFLEKHSSGFIEFFIGFYFQKK